MSSSTITATTAASAVASTVTKTLTKTVASVSPSASMRASPQGGILEGGNPSVYSPSNPIILFIIQAGIIITFCRLLHWPLSKLRQPRVIAEVIGGILLGPSVMGHVPGFSAAIFPPAALPNLTLVANLGLIFFLFLVGLEVDLRYVASNLKIAVSVGVASMMLPFGLGCAIAYGLYHEFREEPGTTPVSFGTYLLFVGVAMAITAFPVLCRILTELKLLDTPVGVIVLSAGVSNDITGWILLALCVALVNAASGITALWVLLTAIGYTLFLFGAVRPTFMLILRRTHSLENGPSQSIVLLTLMIALTSSFFTGVIGIHPIFGAFMAGLICPHEGGFAIKLTEKIEDLISTIFLPLYFALSGLSTNLGLLDSGIVWGYVVAVIACAFFGKLIAGTMAARFCGLVWRESLAIGSLMSCKGLVELIVLNIGLQAKILSQRTFTIFVVMALVTTFATTPLVAALYPPWYQKKLEAWKRGEIDWDTGLPIDRPTTADMEADHIVREKQDAQTAHFNKILVYLRLDSMPSLLTFTSLLSRPQSQNSTTPFVHPSKRATTTELQPPQTPADPHKRPTSIHAMRLIELTQRDSTVMKVSEVDSYTARDPVLNTFRTFGSFHNLAISGEVSVIPTDTYAATLTGRASERGAELLVLPWSETGGLADEGRLEGSDLALAERVAPGSTYADFVNRALEGGECNVAVLVDYAFAGAMGSRSRALQRTLSGVSLNARRYGDDGKFMLLGERRHHVFLPFCGGKDDRLALKLVMRLLGCADVTATVVYYDTMSDSTDGEFFTHVQSTIPSEVAERVVFEHVTTSTEKLGETFITRARSEIGQQPHDAGDIVILGRGHGRSLASATSPGGRKTCLGEVSDLLLASGLKASICVVQAKS